LLGFLLKHETGWLGLADVVVVDSVARNGLGLRFAIGNVVVSGLVNGVGLGLVNGVGLGLVNGVCLGLVNGVGLGLVNGVGLGLEVVEPCRIWVFFFFLFNFLVLKLWNLTLFGC
jgi:hypothetical protein